MSQLQSFEVLLFAHFQEIGEASMEHLKSNHALIKNKTKFSLYIRKFRWDRVQSYMRKGFLIYEEMREFFPIYEEAFNHI